MDIYIYFKQFWNINILDIVIMVLNYTYKRKRFFYYFISV